MKAVFTVISGQDEGLEFTLEAGETVVLGRSRKTDVKLRDAEISRKHCQIHNTGEGLVMTDLESSNGTYLNGRRIRQADLIDGDVVRLGHTEIKIVTASDEAPSSDAKADSENMMGAFDEYIGKDEAQGDEADGVNETTEDSGPLSAPAELLAPEERVEPQSEEIEGEPEDSDWDLAPMIAQDKEEILAPEEPLSAVPERPAVADIPRSPDDLIGQTLAGCRIEEHEEDIDTCWVFKGEQLSIGRPLMLYVLRPDIAASSAERARFMNAARAAGRVYHPNLVHIYDAVDTGEWACMLTEYVEGESAEKLMERWAQANQFDFLQALDIARQTAAALAAAHAQGVIHRNVRPASIRVTPRGEAKLSNLGLARAMERPAQAAITPVGLSLGDPRYAAPEQVQGAPDVDHRVDIYALGATLFALVTGRAPYEAGPGEDVGLQATQQSPPSPKRINPDAPPELCMLIEKAMAPQPAHRFPSAQHMLEAIDAVAQALQADA